MLRQDLQHCFQPIGLGRSNTLSRIRKSGRNRHPHTHLSCYRRGSTIYPAAVIQHLLPKSQTTHTTTRVLPWKVPCSPCYESISMEQIPE